MTMRAGAEADQVTTERSGGRLKALRRASFAAGQEYWRTTDQVSLVPLPCR
jgi:hypothetical protein